MTNDTTVPLNNAGSATPPGFPPPGATGAAADNFVDDTLEDSFTAMMAAIQAFHDKHDFASKGGEELMYRIALMTEELGEISAAVTKGRPKEELAEECADLFILLLGTAISADFDLGHAFWSKMSKLLEREGRMIDGRIRVSDFRAVRARKKATMDKATLIQTDEEWAKATVSVPDSELQGVRED
jgi:NTP pyrophosphatase (non-canonical NTP hydrolase)